MRLYDKIVCRAETLAVVGLGYVGMPIAHAFAKKGLNVIGFDLNTTKIELYKSGIDPTKEVGDGEGPQHIVLVQTDTAVVVVGAEQGVTEGEGPRLALGLISHVLTDEVTATVGTIIVEIMRV